jgi:hypothetical protein
MTTHIWVNTLILEDKPIHVIRNKIIAELRATATVTGIGQDIISFFEIGLHSLRNIGTVPTHNSILHDHADQRMDYQCIHLI